MSKKRKPADGLLPRAEAWRQSSSEYKARVHRAVIDDKPHQGADGRPVRMVPAMRAKILDKITAAAAHEDRQRNLGRRRKTNNETRDRVDRVLSQYKQPELREHIREQFDRFKASGGCVDIRQFKAVRLDILKQSK